ncbi:MAG: beta-CASP ribonuclease aCPSF1 [Candidatus Woesearchaeota archaeon]
MPTEIIKEIYKHLPKEKISDAVFEGANIVLYTKDGNYYLDNQEDVKQVVYTIKKRIELRPDPSICLEQKKAEKLIKQIVPQEAGLDQIIFDPQRSIVIIEVDKPGVAIGKTASILQEIGKKTFWVAQVRRKPSIRSKMVEDIRSVLYINSDERRNFLNNCGERIYNGWLRGKKEEWIRVTYLGSGRHVGRSCLLLQTPESRILLDCGVDVGSKEEAYPMLDAPEFRVEELDAIIISHAHLDHIGFLPYLFKYGYRGPVYCTEPTRDIMTLSLLDYVKIQVSSGENPLYTSEEIKQVVMNTITLNYEEVTDITPDVRITFHNSGHIMGSALTHIHIGNGLHNILYTGDLKYGFTKLLDPAVSRFQRVESLLMEGTYGSRDQVLPPKEQTEQQFEEIITYTVKEKKGKVLIPVLGVGRAQEVLLYVDEMIKAGRIPQIPIYLDGMVWEMTAIHTAYPEFLNATIRKKIFHENDNPFLSENFKRVGSRKERQELLEQHGPCIIIATSGMLQGGASVEYLKFLAEDKRHTLIFVSYQGAGTMGRRITQGERDFAISVNGAKPENVTLKLDIHVVEGLSGHSDRKELMNYIARMQPKPRRIMINHGEASRCLDLASSIFKQHRIESSAPRNLESVRLR